MRVLMLIIFMALLAGPVLAQPPKVYGPDITENYARKKRMFAIYSINRLKNGGALLVRLSTRHTAADLYRKNGQESVAQRIEQEQLTENKNIVKAFKENFTFCPVYFFYGDSTEPVKKGVKSGYFLNGNLEVDKSITLKEDFFMVAEYAPLESESFQFPQEGGVPVTDHSGSLDRVLLLRDSYFVQMRKPFPRYVVGRLESLSSTVLQVKRLNAKLARFYKKKATANPVDPFAKK